MATRPAKTVTLRLRVTPADAEAWRTAARINRLSLSELIRRSIHASAAGQPMRGCRNQQRHEPGVRCSYCGRIPE